MRPFAVDANAITLFQKERIAKDPGNGMAAVSAIIASDCIALDEEKLCLQEWIDSAKGAYPFALEAWIADMLVLGKIRYFGLAPNACRKKLLSLGLPQKDHKWIRLAIGSGGKVIITGDIDFFDPSKKNANAEEKEKIVQSGKGPCAKAVGKEYGVEIIHTCAVENYLRAA